MPAAPGDVDEAFRSPDEIAELKGSDNKKVYLVYIAKPPSPQWGHVIINGNPVFDPSNSNTQELTLPSKTHREIAQRMLSYIGISLRDQEPMAYADQDKSQFKSILTVKVDGHPWILKGGFSREKMLDIVDDIKKIQGVKAFNIKDDSISAL